MIKYHKIIAVSIGLIFVIVLQKFATPEPIFRFLLPAFIIFAGTVTLYNRWYLMQKQKYNIWILVRPGLLLAAGFGIFLVIPSEVLRGLFLLSSVFVITFFEIVLGNFAENILLNETLFIAFGLFFGLSALYQYAPIYGTLCVVAVFIFSFLLSRSFYEFVPKGDDAKIIGSLALSLFCSELFWALNFLPLHFSVLALILFNFFYFALILNYYHLFHILNLKKLQFHLFLIVVCSALVVAATPWKILT